MKFLESIKEIWKANKWGYLTSSIIIVFGCLFLYVKNKSPLIYSIPLGLLGLGLFMFAFGLFFWSDN